MNAGNYHIQGPQINQFNNVAPRPIPRSSFNRSFTQRTTFNASVLVPIFIDEILPGDDVNISLTHLTRMATPIKPVMDNLYFETFWFFVPNRLVWDNWEKFQGQQTDPGDSVAYTIPVLDNTVAPLSTTGFPELSVWDFWGLPTKVTSLDNISALPNRMMNLIWNEWFRDENLQASKDVPTGDGPDNPTTYYISGGSSLYYRGKRKDYFTSCLPWPQKGTAISVPITGSALVTRVNNSNNTVLAKRRGTNTTETTAGAIQNLATGVIDNVNSGTGINLDPNGTLEVDGSAFTAVTINTLRQAALYQQILELDARAGTRYVESLYSRWGVISPDFRLQRPELIGQGSNRINVYAVPQTAPTTDDTTPQGNLAGYSVTSSQGQHGCRYAATEHGMILAFANVRADLTYQQGVDKMWTRQTRLDFYEPLLNGLGEQAVLNGELLAQGTSTDQSVFGYQERFAEYRYKPSKITGAFRSNYTGSLDVWGLWQEFGALPTLNEAFIQEDVPMDRVLAVTDEPNFLSDMFFSYNHVRAMPIRSNPGIDIL